MKTATHYARGIFSEFSSRKGIRHELDAWEPGDIDALRGEVLARVEVMLKDQRDTSATRRGFSKRRTWERHATS